MPYITIKLRPKEQQISFDDILNGIQESVFDDGHFRRGRNGTRIRGVRAVQLRRQLRRGGFAYRYFGGAYSLFGRALRVGRVQLDEYQRE